MNWPAWLFVLLVSIGLSVGVFKKALEKPEYIQKAHANPLLAQPQQGKAASFSLPDRQGRRYSLSDFKGKSVLLNFWATWCKPCKDELPDLAALARRLAGKRAVLVLVSVDEDWSAIDRLAEQFENPPGGSSSENVWLDAARLLRGQIEGTVSLIDPSKGTAKTYGTTKFPETYLIGPEGDVVYRFIGPKLWARPDALEFVTKSIDALLPDMPRNST